MMMGEKKIRMALVGTTALLAWMSLASLAQAASITVNATTTVAGSGCSFEEAITSVNNQAAFDACTISGTGTINAITIPGNANPYVAANINDDIHRSVTISGPTTGTSAILQFSGGNIASGSDSGLHMSGGAGISVTIQNVTVRGTTSNFLSGVFDVDATLTLNTVHLTNFGYAGLHNNTGVVHVNNCTIDGNGIFGSLPFGGGISNGGSLTIAGSTIANNFAFQGAGIADLGGVTLTDSKVTGNTSIDDGAGIYTTSGVGLTRTLVDANSSGNRGGGVFVAVTGGANFTQSTISNNDAIDGGGIYIDGDGSNTQDLYDGTMINDNFASGDGGGLYSTGQESQINNTSFVHNSATNGGGIFRTGGGEFHIQHSTIAKNSATQVGGGLNGSINNPIFFATIIANNTAGTTSTADLSIGRNDPIAQYCLVQNAGSSPGSFPASAGNITGVDPLFGTRQNLGGPTTVLPLLNHSTAIDRIPASAETFTTDQRGTNFIRPRDGNDGATPARNGSDIGAYEQYLTMFETEAQTAVAQTTGITHTTVSDVRASAGAMTNLRSNASGQFVTYRVAGVPSGTFTLIVRVKKGSNAGIFQLAVATAQGGPYTNIPGTQDTYAATDTWADLSLGAVTFSSSGTKYFRFTTTGKNSASSSFQLFPDFIMPR